MSSHQHGEHDPAQQKWFCGYWMTLDEWLDIHDYAPATQKQEEADVGTDEETIS